MTSPKMISTYVTLSHFQFQRLTYMIAKELFRRIGRVQRLQLRFDRSGRSEGTAYVTYESKDDALEAIRQFDGANANGAISHSWQ